MEHVTFSGDVAQELSKSVLYISERCVFRLSKDGLDLEQKRKSAVKSSFMALSAVLIGLHMSEAIAGPLPDPYRTPGWTNPNVTPDNIKRTICRSGWTKTIRPPVRYTNQLKRQQIIEYGFKDKKLAHYEEDHLISLQLGGHPTDPRNLWPEAYAGKCGARVKDVLETRLKRLVCAGELSLLDAQRLIAHNWVDAYRNYVKPLACPGS